MSFTNIDEWSGTVATVSGSTPPSPQPDLLTSLMPMMMMMIIMPLIGSINGE